MTLSSSKEAVQAFANVHPGAYFLTLPINGCLESTEQIRRFELLRLAFFVLKLRQYSNNLEQRLPQNQWAGDGAKELIHAPQAPTDVLDKSALYNPHSTAPTAESEALKKDAEFHCSLLRHVIFQQVLALIRLDAREQALQIITACRK